MPIIFAVGLFCYDQFEETPNEKVVNMSKVTKPYFNMFCRTSKMYVLFPTIIWEDQL